MKKSNKNTDVKQISQNWDVIEDDEYSSLEGDWPGARKVARYVIVDSSTGKIIDDANGYGYKSKQSAYKAGYYKLNRKKIESNKRIVKSFLKSHKDFADNVEWAMFDDLKCNEEFTIEELVEIANRYNLKLPLEASVFLKCMSAI